MRPPQPQLSPHRHRGLHADSCVGRPCRVGEAYSSKYRHDPSFGGKLSLTGFKGRDQAQCAVPPVPPSTAALDRPRIVHDPTYADEQSRCLPAAVQATNKEQA